MIEKWKDVKKFEGLYQVSNYGNVRSITRYKKMLKPSKDKDGYRYVKLKRNGKEKHCRICRLVAVAFLPNDTERNVVNHIDTNRENDRVDNLEWCTAKENVLHSVKLGKYKGINAKPVKQIKNGVCIKVWDSMEEAASALNIFVSNISYCVSGKRKTTGGFMWELV